MLKIVNSPFYSLSRKFTTISESVAYIGLDALRSVVYSASASNILKGSFLSYGYKKDLLWKHSFATAFLSKNIGKLAKLHDKTCEELFVGGLLHDIGKIILGFLAKKENITFKNSGDSAELLSDERKQFFFSHDYVGGMIADKWRLPELHKNIITSHHTPNDTNSKVVYLGDNLSKVMLEIPCNEEMLAENFMKFLSIDEKNYLEFKEKSFQLFNELEQEGVFS